MNAPTHPENWSLGWLMILAAFVSGAGLGLFFHRPDFWGGYDSLRRRMARLGHIALAALGMMNVLYGLSPWPPADTPEATRAMWGLIVGGWSMPVVCFATAWKPAFRHLFFVPVTALIMAALVLARWEGLR